MSYAIQHLKETAEIVAKLDPVAIEKGAQELVGVRNRGGRLFILGVGGSAANASHAVNDFRKIAGLEVYAPTDNVSELTARTNDDGWASVFVEWLRGSRLNSKDALLILFRRWWQLGEERLARLHFRHPAREAGRRPRHRHRRQRRRLHRHSKPTPA